MKRDGDLSARELEELIARARIVRPLPDVVRARALARGRAMLAAKTAAPPAALPGQVLTAPAPRRGLRIAVAASIASIIGAAGAFAAMGVRIREPIEPPAPAGAVTAPARRLEAPALPISPPASAEPKSVARLPGSTRPAAAPSHAAELALLLRIQSAYAERDFSGALGLGAEHARRFPNGRLAEEREALRVRSLAGLGRTEEARRAAGAFARRFPRSVLLPRLRQTPGTGD
jgi:hypothetical protein